MRGAVKRSFAETAKKGDGILNVLELSDSIKGATTEQPHRHAHSFPNRLTLNKSPFHPVSTLSSSSVPLARSLDGRGNPSKIAEDVNCCSTISTLPRHEKMLGLFVWLVSDRRPRHHRSDRIHALNSRRRERRVDT